MRARPARSLQARQARCGWRWSDCVARRSSSEGRAPCQVPRLPGNVGPTSFCASFHVSCVASTWRAMSGCAVLARKARARAAGRGRRTHAPKRINNDKGPAWNAMKHAALLRHPKRHQRLGSTVAACYLYVVDTEPVCRAQTITNFVRPVSSGSAPHHDRGPASAPVASPVPVPPN